MASSLIRNQVLRKELRVRVPCPPLIKPCVTRCYARLFSSAHYAAFGGVVRGATLVQRLREFHKKSPGVPARAWGWITTIAHRGP